MSGQDMRAVWPCVRFSHVPNLHQWLLQVSTRERRYIRGIYFFTLPKAQFCPLSGPCFMCSSFYLASIFKFDTFSGNNTGSSQATAQEAS